MKPWQFLWGFGAGLTELGYLITEVGTDIEGLAESKLRKRKQRVVTATVKLNGERVGTTSVVRG